MPCPYGLFMLNHHGSVRSIFDVVSSCSYTHQAPDGSGGGVTFAGGGTDVVPDGVLGNPGSSGESGAFMKNQIRTASTNITTTDRSILIGGFFCS
ncbi:MAG: hypothetical protein D3906_01890 [Candidatus Electrothrix sp. AUS1_2]|nr:hypothetical protein [Candidatus Electrothrix sp. AUS1_2]